MYIILQYLISRLISGIFPRTGVAVDRGDDDGCGVVALHLLNLLRPTIVGYSRPSPLFFKPAAKNIYSAARRARGAGILDRVV